MEVVLNTAQSILLSITFGVGVLICLIGYIIYEEYKSRNPKQKKAKKYKMSVTEAVCSGDKYIYTVEATSHTEAFKKLVEMFYGSRQNDDVESDHNLIHYPGRDHFEWEGMPGWFAALISGSCGDSYERCRAKLEAYAKENGITLRE